LKQHFTSNAQLLISKEALYANIATYRHLLGDTKMLVMVKSNGYGTDALMVAKTIEHTVDYLGVAFPATGLMLRENGITAPIFVMAGTPNDLKEMASHQLEPVLYSMEMVKAAITLGKPMNVHLEIEAGMKRLGLYKEELDEVVTLINNSALKVVSAFAHVVAPAEPTHDEFTHTQATYFNACFDVLQQGLNHPLFKQLMPTGGVLRFSEYQYDMVRLGIGIYGYDSANKLNKQLKPVATLQCTILQILEVKKGETIGYSRKGSLPYNGKIATLSIGYGDGYLRVFGNGNAEVLINGKRAKTVGNICMDLVMVDVTHINCTSGDKVELFGSEITIAELAEKAATIPYEILTNINTRIARVLVD